MTIPETFVCAFCDQEKDFHSQAVISAAHPDRADFVVTGMPAQFLGFCLDCLESADK